jgi:ABC-type multidrug transport system permease subunit
MPVYYLDPFKYLLGALVSFTTWNEEVVCTDSEYGYFDPPDGVTCGSYLSDFMQQATGYLDNPVFPAIFNPDIYAYKSQEATTDCLLIIKPEDVWLIAAGYFVLAHMPLSFFCSSCAARDRR